MVGQVAKVSAGAKAQSSATDLHRGPVKDAGSFTLHGETGNAAQPAASTKVTQKPSRSKIVAPGLASVAKSPALKSDNDPSGGLQGPHADSDAYLQQEGPRSDYISSFTQYGSAVVNNLNFYHDDSVDAGKIIAAPQSSIIDRTMAATRFAGDLQQSSALKNDITTQLHTTMDNDDQTFRHSDADAFRFPFKDQTDWGAKQYIDLVNDVESHPLPPAK